MPTIAQLKEKSQQAATALFKAERRQRDRIHKSLIGRTYKFHNSYATQERWWLYVKVTALREGGLVVFKFQIDHAGRIEVYGDDRMISISEAYLPIPKAEFNAAWKETLARIKALKP